METLDIYFIILICGQVLQFILSIFQSIKHGHFESECWRRGNLCCKLENDIEMQATQR